MNEDEDEDPEALGPELWKLVRGKQNINVKYLFTYSTPQKT